MGFIDTLTTKGPIEDSRIDYFLDAVPRDCVLYLPLARNRLRGDTFRSLDSYRHPCTVTGALWTPQGRKFDGVDDYITVPDHAALDITDALTIVAWIKPNVTANASVVAKFFYGGALNNSGYRFRVQLSAGNYQLNATVYNDGVSGDLTGSTNLTVNGSTWYQVGTVYTGAADGKLEVFVNAVSDGSSTGHNLGVKANAYDLLIGADDFDQNGVLATFFKGLMGEVQMFNRALTPQEIQRFYLATKGRYQ